jgi:hypothetical protein
MPIKNASAIETRIKAVLNFLSTVCSTAFEALDYFTSGGVSNVW